MKKLSKLLAMLMAVAMICGMIAVAASAADVTLPREGTLYFAGRQWGAVNSWNIVGTNQNIAMAVVLLVVFGVNLKIAPLAGGYASDMIPNLSWPFIKNVITHYQLPFWSIVLISIGGQAIGMRSMSIYELNADYVKYSRFLGIKDSKIVGYVFRNAMLPQIMGLAMGLGTMMGGALVAEKIFSYPGLGNTMYKAIVASDYPLISACTLIITIMVLLANFLLDIVYGLIDPRVKAAQVD